MWQHRDKIIFEVAGHDHLADLRTHSADQIFDKESQCMVNILNQSDYFLTKLVSPSITPTRGSQPGYSTLIYDEET